MGKNIIYVEINQDNLNNYQEYVDEALIYYKQDGPNIINDTYLYSNYSIKELYRLYQLIIDNKLDLSSFKHFTISADLNYYPEYDEYINKPDLYRSYEIDKNISFYTYDTFIKSYDFKSDIPILLESKQLLYRNEDGYYGDDLYTDIGWEHIIKKSIKKENYFITINCKI